MEHERKPPTTSCHRPRASFFQNCLVWLAAAFTIAQSSPAALTTTIITHGFTVGSKGAWVEGMCDAIIARAVADNPGDTGAVYRYQVATGRWRLLPGYMHDPAGHVALIFNWTTESDLFKDEPPNWRLGEGAGDALYAALRAPVFEDSAGVPLSSFDIISCRAMHFIGHSRGCTVNSETVKRLAFAGCAVDQVTALDPHPVNGTLDACLLPSSTNWGDSVPVKWENVNFMDGFWRTDSDFCDFNGMALPAPVLNTQFTESIFDCSGCGDSYGHIDTHLWYHGTIDLAPNASDGEYTINTTMNNTWWSPPHPGPRELVGWYYSHLGGGTRPAQGPGMAAPEVPMLFNGNFDQSSAAGWRYHGGGSNGESITGGVLRIGASSGGATYRQHNRFYLEEGAGDFSYDYRVTIADAVTQDDVLLVVLVDTGGANHVVDVVPLNQVTAFATRTVPLPVSAPLGNQYTLIFAVDFGAALVAQVEIDNVSISRTAAVSEALPGTRTQQFARSVPSGGCCPGDTDGNNAVDVNDITFTVFRLGNSGTPGSVPGDADGNGSVDVNDISFIVFRLGTPCD